MQQPVSSPIIVPVATAATSYETSGLDISAPSTTPEPRSLIGELDELNNTLRARFYNSNFEKIREIPVRDVIKALEETNDVLAIVFDGIITQRLVDLASSRGVKKLVGVKKGNVNKIPEGIEVLTKMK
jgi:DNA primase